MKSIRTIISAEPDKCRSPVTIQEAPTRKSRKTTESKENPMAGLRTPPAGELAQRRHAGTQSEVIHRIQQQRDSGADSGHDEETAHPRVRAQRPGCFGRQGPVRRKAHAGFADALDLVFGLAHQSAQVALGTDAIAPQITEQEAKIEIGRASCREKEEIGVG